MRTCSSPAPAPVLVLGTGRCGSTLVSEMIRDHPDALSVSELFSFLSDFGTRIERALPGAPLSGAAFWSLLSTPQPRQTMLLRHGLQMAEVTYPWDRGRFRAASGLPPVLQATLPHLAPDDPDRLFDDIGAAVATWPIGPIGDHYRRLFGWLQHRFAKRSWVERSGGSLRVAARLLRTFPEVRVLHIVRDGRATALSMSNHIGFRMALLCGLQTELLGADPYDCDDRSEEADLSDELAALLPEHFTRRAFDAFELDPALCGHYWSGEIINGLAALSDVPPQRLLTVRYEDLLSEPEASVRRIGTFLGEGVCQAWVQRAASRVEQRQSLWVDLSERARSELEAACAPGFAALGALGLHWS